MPRNEMQRMWDSRSKENAFYCIESAYWDGDIEKFFALGQERTEAMIDPVLSDYLPEESRNTAVEIGCGAGRFSRHIARRFFDVIALDVSAEMIAKAKELHTGTEFQNLSFSATNGTSLEIVESKSADFVFSYEVFQHMPTMEVIQENLNEIGRVLSDSGIALLQFRTKHNHANYKTELLLKKVVPPSVWLRLGYKPLTFDSTWNGPAFSDEDVVSHCEKASLEVIKLTEDHTHDPGTRKFAIAKRVR